MRLRFVCGQGWFRRFGFLKMNALVYCLLVSFCAHLGGALPRGITSPRAHDFTAVLEQAKVSVESRNKRDTCDEILNKIGGPPYSTCFELLQPVQIDNPGSTEDKVREYCTADDDCSTIIRELFQELKTTCPGGDPIPELTRATTEICDLDLREKYCGDEYISGSMFDSDMQATYDDCITDYAGGKDCSRNCDTITEYIVNNIGCCYTIVEQYRTTLLGEKEVTSEIFEECGRTEPDPCDG